MSAGGSADGAAAGAVSSTISEQYVLSSGDQMLFVELQVTV